MEDQTGSSETDVRAYPDRRSTIVIHGIAALGLEGFSLGLTAPRPEIGARPDGAEIGSDDKGAIRTSKRAQACVFSGRD